MQLPLGFKWLIVERNEKLLQNFGHETSRGQVILEIYE
jgi:hypothetical protein